LSGELRELLREASGHGLEIGAGDRPEHRPLAGLAESLALSEPDPHMAAQLRKRVARSRRPAQVVEAPGEQLPLEDSSFDTVAMTLCADCSEGAQPSQAIGPTNSALRRLPIAGGVAAR
jgi:hypothetical protein